MFWEMERDREGMVDEGGDGSGDGEGEKLLKREGK